MTAAPTPALPFVAPIQEPEGVAKIGFYVFCFFTFALFSRLFDLYLYFLHLPGIAEGICLLAAFLCGGIMRVSKTRVGLALLALTMWMFATLPTAFWHGGSIQIVTGNWLHGVAAFAMATALIITVRQCRKLLFTVGVAGAVGAALLYFKGAMINGRLMLNQGRFKNSNDAAMLLLLALPCLCLILIDARVSKLWKGPILASMAIVLIAIAKTGSRGSVIGFLVLCVVVFLQVSAGAKAKMLVAALLVTAAFFTVVPQNLRARYVTIFNNSSDDISVAERNFLASATGSSEDRLARLIDSLKLTIKKPIFGVGPGNFAPYYAREYEKQGKIYNWNGTHNTYTQFSSETGIPGLILYLMVLIFSIKDLGKVYRRAKAIPGDHARNLANMAATVRAIFVAYCVCTFFAHVGYDMTLPVMAGLAAAVVTAGELELAAMERGSGNAPIMQCIPLPAFRRRPAPVGVPAR